MLVLGRVFHAFPGEDRYGSNTKYFLPDGVQLLAVQGSAGHAAENTT